MSTSIIQFNHLRIPLDEIQEATNNFSEKNIIGKGGFGNVYKGQLLRSGELIKISARRLDRSQGQGDFEFWTEVSVLSSLKHPNIVSLIGFCDEEGEKIIINRHEAKGSLGMYLSNPALTWIQRSKIIVGVARAISYLHYEEGRNYSIIHRNINSATILLDDNFEAKLSGFEYSIKNSVDRTERYISSEAICIQGYTDPQTLQTGHPTQTSDIYSFGVVLSEIMCGKTVSTLKIEIDTFPAPIPIIIYHLKLDMLDKILIPDMWNQIGPELCSWYVDITLACLNQGPEERLTMDQILPHLIRLLENQLGTVTPESSFAAENNALQPQVLTIESMSSDTRKVNKLEHLRIGLKYIQSATNNFSKESELWSGDRYHVYKGDLECFDREYVSFLEDKNKCEIPKRRYNNVRIQCINNANAEPMFHKEIEIVSTCKHDNIDSLLGFCDEGSHMILVYEGDTYNQLDMYLASRVLTWGTRLKICLDVAHGLNYLHNEMEDQKMVIHRQLGSFCILLDGNWQGAKITGFGLSTFHENQDEVPLLTYAKKDLLDRWMLCSMAPEISKRIDGGMRYDMAKATKESDIYSFGLVMFELLSGMDCSNLWAYDVDFQAGQWFKDRIIKQKLARVLREENRGNKLFLKKGPNEDSLDTFIEITEQCLVVNPEQRPTLQVIIKQLEKALMFQKNHKDPLRMSFEVIKLATQSFSDANKIGGGGFGRVYKGELASEHGSYTIVAKRLDTRLGQGDQQFYNELHILSEYKHENVIGLVGYNNDEHERIIVYEYASKGSLDNYLNDASLTWINRLNICKDVARALLFLHGGVREHEAVIHRDMKTANILLFDDWKAKVADFGLSLICTISGETDYVIDHACGTPGYLDPLYQKSRILTRESDIYSFGVILLEILCGRSTYKVYEHEGRFLHSLVKQCFEEARLDDVVFNAIKDQILPQSLATFLEVAFQCLHDDREKRPTAQHVLVQLQKALELQEEEPSKWQGILDLCCCFRD
ncbi:protein kinase-like domain, Concanavalin A-like lectin/glucanase domain protein [Artemisia annua]|uniref:Protein kinase-like domain, Concanavalin A-like lectin/glucanase domain protein n=1 Tax=Artemisia annua TaxID=35608 RepID=A0A2U1LBV6_ARTAN|nr:protein kinase-like domain, Concanavalin A-like lectin/glucanase domain protein [Artemisia annua]